MSNSLWIYKTFLLAALMIAASLCSGASAAVICTEESEDAANSELPIYEWSDSSKHLNGIVVTVHGATQQASSFDTLARQLAGQGFLVCSVDLRGHGKWHFKPHQFTGGYTVDYKQSSLDLERLFAVLKKDHPDLPIYAIGESCGAAVLVSTAARNPQLCKGIILASVGTHPRHFNPDFIFTDAVAIAKHCGRPLLVSKYIKKYSSDDPRIPAEMLADPLSRRTMSVKELIATVLFIHTTPDNMKKLPEDMPLLMLQGTEDNVCSPTSVKQIVRNKAGDDKQLVFMQDCGHVLLGTKFIKPQVSKVVIGWLTKHKDMVVAENAGPVASREAVHNPVSILSPDMSVEKISQYVIQN
jgi:acylglycerol lipase